MKCNRCNICNKMFNIANMSVYNEYISLQKVICNENISLQMVNYNKKTTNVTHS